MDYNSFKVLMLGYQRVGKTSLLASMYRATQEELAQNYTFKIKPGNDATAELLSDAEDRLASATEYLVNDKIEPSEVWRNFPFEFISENQTIFKLDFLDYKGEALRDRSSEQAKKVRQWLQGSVAIIIPIDSPALMESTGEWVKVNEKWNNPRGIEGILRAEQTRDIPRLVIFAPVKCEKYLYAGKAEELRRKVEESYSSLLDYLRGETGVRKNCVVIIPVETIGGAKFTRFEKFDEEVEERFVNPERKYEPKYGDQLLRYIARFALARLAEKNLIRIDELTGEIVDDIGWCPPEEDKWSSKEDKRKRKDIIRKHKESLENKKIEKNKSLELAALIKSGLQSFAQGCNQDRVFRVIMGASLLDSEN